MKRLRQSARSKCERDSSGFSRSENMRSSLKVPSCPRRSSFWNSSDVVHITGACISVAHLGTASAVGTLRNTGLMQAFMVGVHSDHSTIAGITWMTLRPSLFHVEHAGAILQDRGHCSSISEFPSLLAFLGRPHRRQFWSRDAK